MTKQKSNNPNGNFSQILNEMRNLAIAITKDKRIRVKYVPEQATSAFNMETYEITLSLQSYPDFVRKFPRLFRKVLDGDMGHECGHLILTKPNWEFFNNWATKIKRQRGFYKLAHEICNIVEDKRVNHFIILRYRFDIGKRLLLANLILQDMMNNEMEEKKIIAQIQTPSILQGANVGNVIQLDAGESLDMTVDSKGHTQTTGTKPNVKVESGKQEGVYMVAILINQGLYEAKCTQLWKQLTPEAKKDCELALKALERVKYKRIKLDLIRSCQEIYDLVAKHLKADYTTKEYVCSRRGGNIKGQISDKLKQLLEAEEQKEEKEEEEKKQKEDLAKGSGCGQGTGEEINAPEPNFEAYSTLLDECKPEISELLNLLKVKMKPRVERAMFQKRGKMMSPIIPRIYTNSFRGTVRNVYLRTTTRFEKEPIKIGFMFDFSGSVDKHEAEKITTVLNEVFGHYVNDGDFAITAFGADSQRLKVFNESYQNTRARIGNISVNSAGTEMAVLLEAFLKMFSCFKNERKVLVIASDFCTSDENECNELLAMYAKMGIEVYMIGFCNCDNVKTFAQNVKGLKAFRSEIKEISELPKAFLSCWTNYQMDKR